MSGGSGADEVAKLREMVLAEAARRTELFIHLKFSRADALLRVRGNLRWEFEMNGAPRFLREVDAVVNAIYDREEGETRRATSADGKSGRGRRGS
ncbi:MAG: hypothetical protein HYY84_09465 [Deltaproteobacteria bacterium]|nr:hypothetical protein [Deltaproteobacteria bacterium]